MNTETSNQDPKKCGVISLCSMINSLPTDIQISFLSLNNFRFNTEVHDDAEPAFSGSLSNNLLKLKHIWIMAFGKLPVVQEWVFIFPVFR